MLDFKIDFLQFRNGYFGKALRWLIYYILLGRDGWPIEFHAPTVQEVMKMESSEHLYFHIPFCSIICTHCPYLKIGYSPSLAAQYKVSILREFDQHLEKHKHSLIKSVYFGGGTPSLCLDIVGEILCRCSKYLDVNAEIGIELHPRDCSPELLLQLRALGVTSISLGIETFDQDLLHKLGRGYTRQQAESALTHAVNAGFESVDVNLIYGIHNQIPAQVVADAIHCVHLGANQISAYPLISFEHTPLGKSVRRGTASNYGFREMLETQRSLTVALRDKGLDRSSVWSFTLPGRKPFTTVTRESYCGFGAGAGSKVDGLFWFNTFSVTEYCQTAHPHPALVMHASERLRRFHWLYWSIYLTTIDPMAYRRLFGRELEADFRILLLLARLMLIIRKTDGTWKLTDFGADWVHRIQCLYSLSFIDQLWSRCKKDPWPLRVLLQ